MFDSPKPSPQKARSLIPRWQIFLMIGLVAAAVIWGLLARGGG
jgi:hypothetical protein